MEKALLADTAPQVSRMRQADIDAGLVPDVESNADGGSVNGNGDAGEVREEGADDKPKPIVRPSADKALLCKEMPVRSVHTVQRIAIEKSKNLLCETIALGSGSWPRESCKVHAYVVSLFWSWLLLWAGVSGAMVLTARKSRRTTPKPRAPSPDASSFEPPLQARGNHDTAPEKADEYTHMQMQYEAQVKKQLVRYRALDTLFGGGPFTRRTSP